MFMFHCSETPQDRGTSGVKFIYYSVKLNCVSLLGINVSAQNDSRIY
jgi:hypothetical protein